jgi:hypothetical protein
MSFSLTGWRLAGYSSRRNLIIALMVALTLALAGVVALPGHANAAATNHRMTTWNMQQGSTTARWQSLQGSLAPHYDVIALQEVPNDPPDGATPRRTIHTDHGDVEVYRWDLGRGDRASDIRYLSILRQGSRHMGFLTSWYPSQFDVIPGHYRDALAIVNGGDNTMFATVHAQSGNGNDAASLVRRVQNRAGGRNFAVLGDFNREPHDLEHALGGPDSGLHIYDSGDRTHIDGGELDYMVSNIDTNEWQATVLPNPGSDHWPVTFGSLAAAGFHATLTNDRSGGGVGTQNSHVDNGTLLTVSDHPLERNQPWQFLPDVKVNRNNLEYQIHSPYGNNKCVQPQQSVYGPYDARLEMDACHNSTSGSGNNDDQSWQLFHHDPMFPNEVWLMNSDGLVASWVQTQGQHFLWLTLGSNSPDEHFHIHPGI